jgi:hypothetical protein
MVRQTGGAQRDGKVGTETGGEVRAEVEGLPFGGRTEQRKQYISHLAAMDGCPGATEVAELRRMANSANWRAEDGFPTYQAETIQSLKTL